MQYELLLRIDRPTIQTDGQALTEWGPPPTASDVYRLLTNLPLRDVLEVLNAEDELVIYTPPATGAA